MRWNLSKAERMLAAAFAVLLLAALLVPAMPQPGHPHEFADHRSLWGLPCALDVLSNLPFAIGGALGLLALKGVTLAPDQRRAAALFFAGLVATAAASAFFHWAPDAFGLAVDRSGMSVAFAGLLGLLAATQVSDRAGRALAIALLILGPLAAWTAYVTGNIVPWAVVQFGGMLVVLALAFTPARPGALQVRWGWILLAYAAAKLFEANDHAVFEATGQLFSGHTLKHILAALAAWPVIAALSALPRMQNGPKPAARPLARARRA